MGTEEKGATHTCLPAAGGGDISLKLYFAKEAKELLGLLWKAPRLSFMGRRGITVRTKWQSGIGMGNLPAWPFKGNRSHGNGE